MKDLSRWDAAADFTAEDAAALAVGIDPGEAGYTRTKSKALYEHMERSYNARRRWHKDDGPQQCDEFDSMKPERMLESTEMHFQSTQQELDSGQYFSNWLKAGSNSDFETQRFTRQEIARWLSAIGVQSIYPFDGVLSKATTSAEKPLSKRERDSLLTVIAALAKKLNLNVAEVGKTAKYIESLTDEIGAGVSKRTIENYLKQIPNAMAIRLK